MQSRLGLAIISLGEICAYSPLGTGLCVRSTPTKPDQQPASAVGNLCKESGIRYDGMTAEGAQVCFTLTPDRSKWVEIGFRFVRASGCPTGTTSGRTYYEGSELLTVPGRIAVRHSGI